MPTRVLVPIDGSPQSNDALSLAADLFPSATITLFHVVDPVVGEEDDALTLESALESQRERAEELFEAAENRLEGTGVTVETAVAAGSPWREIVAHVEERDVDHVVMGSHGRGGTARFLLGSVAELVVRRAPAPVTVVK